MSDQVEPDNLISYLELHTDEVYEYCRIVSELSSVAGQIVPSQERPEADTAAPGKVADLPDSSGLAS
jgi:hypothetical protein